MSITVLFFARLREQVGKNEVVISGWSCIATGSWRRAILSCWSPCGRRAVPRRSPAAA